MPVPHSDSRRHCPVGRPRWQQPRRRRGRGRSLPLGVTHCQCQCSVSPGHCQAPPRRPQPESSPHGVTSQVGKRQPARARPGTTLSLQVASAALRQSPSLPGDGHGGRSRGGAAAAAACHSESRTASASARSARATARARNSELQVFRARTALTRQLFIQTSNSAAERGRQTSSQLARFRPGRCDIQNPGSMRPSSISAPQSKEGGKVFQAFHSS